MLLFLNIGRLLTAFLLSVVLVFADGPVSVHTSAFAQANNGEQPLNGSTPGGVNEGSSSDSELWRKIRQGQAGSTAGPGQSGALMIQSAGQDWRLIRNDQLPKYTAWVILGMLLLLSLFFALRGRIRIDHGPSGETMKRFSLIERVGHWLLASSFILLALTGLNLIFGRSLIIPLLGKETFASVTIFGKMIHNYVAFAFMLGLVMIVVMWIRHNIPGWTDVKWLLRGGGLVGGGHPPAKKFNAGQKIIFWLVVLCGISISLSGWALMNPFTMNMFSGTFSLLNGWFGTSYPTDLAPIQEQQYQALWHSIMAVFMIAVILAHIYIGSVGMEGALPAMTSGEVDTNWAREHHSLWVEKEEAKLPPASSAASATSLVTGSSNDASGSAANSNVASEAGSKKVSAATPPPVPQPPLPSTKPTAAAEVQGEPLGSTSSDAHDDLKRIKGIGPQNEQRLHSVGITRFEQIAAWTKQEQQDIGERLAFPGRIERENWVEQARALAKENTDG